MAGAFLPHNRVPAVWALAGASPRSSGTDTRSALKGNSLLLGVSSAKTNIPRSNAERAASAVEGAPAPGRHRDARAKQRACVSYAID